MIKYYNDTSNLVITEVEFIKDYISGNHFFDIRFFDYSSIIKAVKEMKSTENFFEILSQQTVKEYFYGSPEYHNYLDRWYEGKADFSANSRDFRTLCFLSEYANRNVSLGMCRVAERVIENYTLKQLNKEIKADLIHNKVYSLTGEIFKGNDCYKVEVDFSDYSIRSYKNNTLLRVRRCYSTMYDLAEFISRKSKGWIIVDYLEFDIEHPEINPPDRYYLGSKGFYAVAGRVEQIYPNPDSNSGKQFEIKVFYLNDILFALENMEGIYSFFEILESDECSDTYAYDPGDDDYDKIKEKYDNITPDLEGANFHTMLTLCRRALTKEFTSKNLKETPYKGVQTYALYKIAEQLLKTYYINEKLGDKDENFPIKVGEKLNIAHTYTYIHGIEFDVEAEIDFSALTISTLIEKNKVRVEKYKSLKELVEAMDDLEFVSLTTPTEEEAEAFWKATKDSITELNDDTTVVKTCPVCGYVHYFINPTGLEEFCEDCGANLSEKSVVTKEAK